MTKYIFVTGGVVSSIGKGIVAASLGRLLKNRGLKVTIQKFDPYINIDPGTMSPYQHGEVYVTDDGAETDLDLGHYERFIDINLNKYSNVTTGKIYSEVLRKERKGEYLGATVQVIPHITDALKDKIKRAATTTDSDVIITEVGGTVGDIESLPFLEALRQIIMFTGVSDVKMEEGSMRCDANISIRPYGQEKFGTKTELKNLNSFNNVRKGLAFEEVRQANVLRNGGEILQETRRFDDATGHTILMRVKEGSSDYRYFPEPDLPNFHISNEWIEEVRASIPEMPSKRRERYVSEFGLPEYDAMVLTLTKEMSDFFDATVAAGADPKQASNWLMGDISAHMNSKKLELKDLKLTPESLAEMIQLIADGTISSKLAKKVFLLLAEEGGTAKGVVEKHGMVQLSDPAQLLPIIQDVLENNAQSIEDFKNGKDRAVGFLVGQIMKQTKGKANPGVVNQLLQQELAKY